MEEWKIEVRAANVEGDRVSRCRRSGDGVVSWS